MKKYTPLSTELLQHLRNGTVIPAHPLVLSENRTFNEAGQKKLTRYYLHSGAGGCAVGVHSTQFEIRDPQYGLFEKVLSLAVEEIEKNRSILNGRPFLKIAGICGPTEQALKEAQFAANIGYDMGLVSMGGLSSLSEKDHLERIRAIAQIIPVFGFYLQPSVGGRIFSYQFWKEFAEIEGVLAIKIASFNRYQTLDAVRGVVMSNRNEEVTLYTGNDDNIVADLMTTYEFQKDGVRVQKNFAGGLLGHWAFWTSKAVELLHQVKEFRKGNTDLAEQLLRKGIAITDVNAAAFDPQNNFHGCIPGIHEFLRRQGLMEGRWCLHPQEELSPNQMEEINRVIQAYPELNDDELVQNFLLNDALNQQR